MFHFEHMEADCLFLDALQKPFDLLKLKKAFKLLNRLFVRQVFLTLKFLSDLLKVRLMTLFPK